MELKIDLAESEGQLLIIFYLTSKEEKERRTLCAINIIFIYFIPIIQSVFIFIFKYFIKPFQQVTALAVIPMSLELWLICGGLILGGFGFFFVLSKVGEKIIVQNKVAPAISDQKYEEDNSNF